MHLKRIKKKKKKKKPQTSLVGYQTQAILSETISLFLLKLPACYNKHSTGNVFVKKIKILLYAMKTDCLSVMSTVAVSLLYICRQLTHGGKKCLPQTL